MRESSRGIFAPLAILCFLAASVFAESDPAAAGDPRSFKGLTMGTTYSVKYRPPANATPSHGLRGSIGRMLEQIEQQMSTYRPDSEVSQFNRQAGTNWFPVSTNLAAVATEALRVSRLTGGAFDITVAPLVDRWGFGPERHTGIVPPPAEIAAARRDVGYHLLEARLSPPALRKSRGAVRIDLSGIAKGHAVDLIGRHLDALGIAHYLVAVGGELKARGSGTTGPGWRVGVEAPDSTANRVQTVVSLVNQGISTSGDYRSSFGAGERRYGHVMDPRSGQPSDHVLASVSVVHASNTLADALATALLVLGPDEGSKLARQEQLACLFMLRTSKGLVERRSDAFDLLQVSRQPSTGQSTRSQTVLR